MRNAIFVLVLGSFLLPTSAARGDWLATRDGSLIETEGGWEVKKGRVVFTRPNGVLASVRVSEVDLERSERITAVRRRAATTGEDEREDARQKVAAKPVVVITESDIPPLPPYLLAELEQEEAAEEDAEDESSRDDSEKVWDTTWRKIDNPSGQGVVIVGSVQNNGPDASAVSLTVRLLDEEGEPITENSANLSDTNLAKGEKSNFRADFPTVLEFSGIEFEIRNRT